MAFHIKLSRIRKEKKLKQKDVAEACGVYPDSISRYENGVITPTVDKAYLIAQRLGVTLDFLMNDDETVAGLSPEVERLAYALEKLSPKDKEQLLAVAHAFIRDAKTREAYS